jgi:hypothetical protein
MFNWEATQTDMAYTALRNGKPLIKTTAGKIFKNYIGRNANAMFSLIIDS